MFKTIIMIILGIVTIQSLPINKTNVTMLGGCNGTQFVCCYDLITSCVYFNCSNCEIYQIGGCQGTKYGCCPDNINSCYNENCTIGCPNTYVL